MRVTVGCWVSVFSCMFVHRAMSIYSMSNEYEYTCRLLLTFVIKFSA